MAEVKKDYILESGHAVIGRTLWNNLVVGDRCTPLDGYNPAYVRLAPEKENSPTCDFEYKNAKIRVIATNNLKIIAPDAESLRTAESDLKEICAGRGIPLVDLDSV